MKEKNLERLLREKVKEAGGIALKIPAIHYAGIPDRIVLLPGARIFFAEVKTAGKTPSPIQKAVHKKIRNLGFRVYIIDSYKILNEALCYT